MPHSGVLSKEHGISTREEVFFENGYFSESSFKLEVTAVYRFPYNVSIECDWKYCALHEAATFNSRTQ